MYALVLKLCPATGARLTFFAIQHMQFLYSTAEITLDADLKSLLTADQTTDVVQNQAGMHTDWSIPQ